MLGLMMMQLREHITVRPILILSLILMLQVYRAITVKIYDLDLSQNVGLLVCYNRQILFEYERSISR